MKRQDVEEFTLYSSKENEGRTLKKVPNDTLNQTFFA
jgi:hypothetical protein